MFFTFVKKSMISDSYKIYPIQVLRIFALD